MRLQKYVKPFEYDARGFLYDQTSAQIYEIPYSAYLMIKKGDFDGLRTKMDNIYFSLTSLHVIVPDDFKDEGFIDSLVRQSAMSSGSRGKIVVLAPSLDCNLHCVYCFEENNNTKKPVIMSKETADNVVRYIRNWVGNNKLEVSWYGGEPLIAYEMIYYISQELKKYYPNFTASITTNGLLLNEKVAKMLQESNVRSAQITVDGPKKIHDKKRPAKVKGVSSYDIIVKNIIDNAKYFDHITFRANIDKDNKDVIFAYWEEMKPLLPSNVNFGLERISATDSTYVDEKEKKKALSDKEWAEFVKKNPSFYDFHILETSYGCGAIRNDMIVIDANGDLFRCWNEIGSKERSVGDVVNGITNWDRYMRYSNISFFDLHKDCQNCFLVASCFGGHCPRRILFPEEFSAPYVCNSEKWVLDDFLIRAILRNDKRLVRIGMPVQQQFQTQQQMQWQTQTQPTMQQQAQVQQQNTERPPNVNLVVNQQQMQQQVQTTQQQQQAIQQQEQIVQNQPQKQKETIGAVFYKAYLFYVWLFRKIGFSIKQFFGLHKSKDL